MKLGSNGHISEDMQETKRQGRIHCKLVIECGGDGLRVNAGVEAREGYHSLRCGPWKRTRVTCFLAGAGGCRQHESTWIWREPRCLGDILGCIEFLEGDIVLSSQETAALSTWF